MTDKEKLNSILRLRLFRSTERELSGLIGYQLRGNHFNRFKDFQCEAYFSMFEKMSQPYMKGPVDLDALLGQYEATSRFYKRHVERTAHERDKTFIPLLLDFIYIGKTDAGAAGRARDVRLCELYAECCKKHELNAGILLLLTYGLIPAFRNKSAQDVKDIVADFQAACGILAQLAESKAQKSTMVYNEMLCLQELRQLVKDELAGGRNLNRLLLILAVNDSLDRIYALMRPDMLRHYSREFRPMDFRLARFWRCETEADNVVWEFEDTNIGHYYLYRKEIDKDGRRIHSTRYQLSFMDTGHRDFCYTIIMRPSYIYHNVLHREQPEGSITFDYTDIRYADDRHTVRELSFSINSPIGARSLSLKPVESEDAMRYYEAYISHKGKGRGFEDIDSHPEYAVDVYTLEVAVSGRCILFNLEGELFRMDKYGTDGNETIAGISSLTHYDNYVYAELNDNGTARHFLCLDQINQNLDLDELSKQPYFNRVGDAKDILGT